jgi:NAD(P)-dependent dehydrogenase (short-subunit alcohol dehydrogenase family)
MTTQPSAQPVALITGAGSGIGRAIAKMLNQNGYRLGLLGRRLDALEETKAMCRGQALCLACDVAAPGEMRRAVAEVADVMGRLDVLVNNAGFAANCPIGGHDEETIRTTLEVNTTAPTIAIASAWNQFQLQGSGCIINVSSMAAIDPFPGFFAYAASKAAVNMLTRVAASEGQSIGVRAFAVCPGAVETPMLRSLFSTAQVPTAAAPEAVATVVLDCIRGRHDALNGSAVLVN